VCKKIVAEFNHKKAHGKIILAILGFLWRRKFESPYHWKTVDEKHRLYIR
jgi:hypothetical protein